MKFSTKLICSTMIVLAAALGFSGFYFVNYVFESALNREIGQALDENSILRFAFETAALNAPAKYDVLQDTTIYQIGANLESGGLENGRLVRLSDEEQSVLYASDGFGADQALLSQTEEGRKTYRVIESGSRYYIQTAGVVNALDRALYLETLKDVTEVFEDRSMGFTVYRRAMLLLLAVGMLLLILISSWLTKPIRALTRATKQMREGDYGYRAKRESGDELGVLTDDFNRMAAALEENVNRLEDEVRAREEFVAAFAHELKTPLTSIIGYADMLRSRKLDEEKSLLSANYIYTEGKRLEAMSLRLLDIIVNRRTQAKRRRIPASSFFAFLQEAPAPGWDGTLSVSCEDGMVWAEADLIKTVLFNLLDNACKASEPGGRVEAEGKRLEDGYRFTIRDHGIGIPAEELSKVTKPFYMVDKSRSRSRNGAGLGLALCVEILRLHESSLEIESEPGKGTAVSFTLPDGDRDENTADKNTADKKEGGAP